MTHVFSTKKQAQPSTLEAYQDKVTAQLRDAQATLDEYESRAKAAGSQAETKAISGLKSAKANIDRRLQDLKATNAEFTSRAKSEIDADVASFKTSIGQLAEKIKNGSKKK